MYHLNDGLSEPKTPSGKGVKAKKEKYLINTIINTKLFDL